MKRSCGPKCLLFISNYVFIRQPPQFFFSIKSVKQKQVKVTIMISDIKSWMYRLGFLQIHIISISGHWTHFIFKKLSNCCMHKCYPSQFHEFFNLIFAICQLWDVILRSFLQNLKIFYFKRIEIVRLRRLRFLNILFEKLEHLVLKNLLLLTYNFS